MSIPALLAMALAAPLIYVPGWLLLQARGRSSATLERVFERVLLGTLLNGWLALLLAELGAFSIWLHLLILALICGAAWRYRRRRDAKSCVSTPARWDAIAITAILIGFGLLTAARPFEVVLGVRDAGVYANTGFAIARTGGIVQHDALVAQIEADQQSGDALLSGAAAQAETNFLGVQPRQRTIATRLRQAGFFINEGDMAAGRVVPQGFHLMPVWIGLLTALAGPGGGLAATGLLGLLGVWSVAMLGRRLGGPWVGVIAALLLALNGPQVWFSRYSTAEAIAQFLTFAGLYAFVVAVQGVEEHRNKGTSESSGALDALSKRSPVVPALLSGLAFGQLALARIDFGLVVLPVLAWLFSCWMTRRWSRIHTWLGGGLLAMLLHAAVHIATVARAYFFDTLFARLQDYALTALVALPFLTPPLRDTYLLRPCSPIAVQPCPPVAGMPPTTFTSWNYPRIGLELVVVLLALLALLALRRWGQPLFAWTERAIQRRARLLLTLSALAIGLLGAYAYLIRPQILSRATLAAMPSCLTPTQLRAPVGPCLALQGYIGAPVAPPPYADPLAAWVDGLPRRLTGRAAPSPATCAAFRDGFLPPTANGLTSVELLRDGAIDRAALGEQRWAELQACDRVVLRDLFANSQPNLVRVGWYLSPLGVLLAIVGLALWWRRMDSASWLFLAVSLIGSFFFIRLTYGTSDQHYIYILRRYVPQVYPALCLGIAYALTALGRVHWRWKIGRAAAISMALVLVAFNLATNLKIFAHTEYAGALQQIGAIAGRFQPNDVILMRGGAPAFASSRDIPDNLATPLTYAYGLNAFTVKSAEPGNYADQLAAYVAHWQSQGRSVYLLVGASGAVALPGLTAELIGPAQLSLREFEQPTSQKPTNVQAYTLDMRLYRLTRSGAAGGDLEIAPDSYADQVRGFYRAEPLAGELLAWTDGDALLRLPRPTQPSTITLRLAPGTTRPASLGVPQVCLSYRAEPRPWVEDPAAPPFSAPACVRLTPGLAEYRFTVDPRAIGEGATILLRLQSDTWIPARDDPAQRDGRQLGVLFGGTRPLR